MEIQAKPTKYNGYEFRSRLEARWAVFFDAAGIKYHYEYQDFMLPSGRYLPDFYLPEFEGGCYAEVKHEFTGLEVDKCKQLCLTTKRPVILLTGVPDFKGVLVFHIVESTKFDDWFNSLPYEIDICKKTLKAIDADGNNIYTPSRAEVRVWKNTKTDKLYLSVAVPKIYGKDGFYWEPGFQLNDLSLPEYIIQDIIYSHFGIGVMAARSAKFEFLNTTS